jgi:hypothetical protein
MTSRFIKGLALIVLFGFYCACKCDTVLCPALESQYSAWLPYKAGDVITYSNGNGQEIQFTTSRYEVSEVKEQHCGPDGFGGCKCSDCPEPFSEVHAETSDSSRKIVNAQGQTAKIVRYLNIGIRKPNEKGDSVFLSYSIFDNNNSMAIGPSVIINSKDSLLPSITIGNRTYSNVITHEVDTLAKPYANPIYNVYFVWKSYYNKEFGIIAFYDLKTRSLFYRKL